MSEGHVHPHTGSDEEGLLSRRPCPGQDTAGPGDQNAFPLEIRPEESTQSGEVRQALARMEAVIAHELAHIRRFDLWVNLIQRVTETLLTGSTRLMEFPTLSAPPHLTVQ